MNFVATQNRDKLFPQRHFQAHILIKLILVCHDARPTTMPEVPRQHLLYRVNATQGAWNNRM